MKIIVMILVLMFCCSVTQGEEDNYISLIDTDLSFQPSTRITFYDNASYEQVYIDWQDGKLVVVGNMDKGAEIFFKHYIKALVDEYIREKLKSNLVPKNRSY